MYITCISNYLKNKNNNYANSNSQVKPNYLPVFGCAIPSKELKAIGDKYIHTITKAKNEQNIYSLIKEYYYERVLPLIAPKKDTVYEDNSILHLFRHELINQTGSPLELYTNPAYKKMAFEMAEYPKHVRYTSFQKRTFQNIVTQIERLASRWGKIEGWKENPDKYVEFSDVRKILGSMNALAESKGINIIITDTVPEGKYTKHAYDLYNVLSQVIINGIKYAQNKTVHISINQAISNKSRYVLTVLNEGTKPIPDTEIDKILMGTGYRGKNNEIKGTGTGFKEIIKILKEHGKEAYIPTIIEKGRSSGVKVSIPFTLYDK